MTPGQIIHVGVKAAPLILKRIASRLLQLVFKLFRLASIAFYRLVEAVLNERTFKEYSTDWLRNFAVVLGCILFTASVNYIPRPDHIFYKFLYRFDTYFFDVWQQPVGSLTGLLLTSLGAYILYYFYYRHNEENNSLPNHYNQYFKLKPLQISSVLMNQGNLPPFSTIDSSRHSTSTAGSASASSTLSPASDSNLFTEGEEEDIFDESTHSDYHYAFKYLHDTNNTTLRDLWRKFPVILFSLAWIILNILYGFKHPVYKTKNIVAWVFHVPVHFIVPPVAGAWLYIWHAPGALRLLTLSLGMLNSALIVTYLLFPNAPPTFIKLYGDNKVPSFDMIYSDGQASEDKKFSFLLHKAIYYATPHKFASFPSLHSAFACLICFFVCHYSKWSWFRLLSVVNVVGQWWAEIYLDHHWRIDSLAGLVYAVIVWTLFKSYYHTIAEVDTRFSRARISGDFVHGSTMGMRLFRGTKLQNFFDPLA